MIQNPSKTAAKLTPDQNREVSRSRYYQQGPELSGPRLDELLGTVAHELRSPIATILSGVYAMTSACELDSVAQQTLKVIEHESCQAMRLVEDLFDLCAGGLGKLSLRKEMVPLSGVVARVAETAAPLFAARQHQFLVSLPPGPLFLRADPLRLTQILTNLLSNAAKFTDPGGRIRLTAEVESDQVVLRVRDNGRGIIPDLLPQVFHLFRQGVDGDHARHGLGIGLALVKSLVELHGGSVAACSSGLGAGAEFIVRLPFSDDGSS